MKKVDFHVEGIDDSLSEFFHQKMDRDGLSNLSEKDIPKGEKNPKRSLDQLVKQLVRISTSDRQSSPPRDKIALAHHYDEGIVPVRVKDDSPQPHFDEDRVEEDVTTEGEIILEKLSYLLGELKRALQSFDSPDAYVSLGRGIKQSGDSYRSQTIKDSKAGLLEIEDYVLAFDLTSQTGIQILKTIDDVRQMIRMCENKDSSTRYF